MTRSPIPSRVPPSAALFHRFWLLRAEEVDPLDCREFVAHRDAPLRLSDDVIAHVNYSLRWVPTLNPGMALAPGHGPNLYGGARIIRGDGAAKLAGICAAWLQLFEHAPEVVDLPGGVSTVNGDDLEAAEYIVHVIEVRRDELLRDLRQLASFAEQAATDERYILHVGL
jgi:hypothetical protein